MKRIIVSILGMLAVSCAFAQTFPVNNLQINGAVSGNVTGSGNVVLQNVATLLGPTVTGATITGGSVNNTPIGNTIPATGAFTFLGSNSGLTVSGGGASITGASSFLTSVTAPTLALGSNSAGVATTAFVANHAPCPSIMDNGGNNTGSADNTAAFNATIAVNSSNNLCVYFPPGLYEFTQGITYNFSNTAASLTLMGAGSDVTRLFWSTSVASGITLNLDGAFNSIHLRDMSVMTNVAGGGSGISIQQAAASIGNPASTSLSDVTNVTVRGYNNASTIIGTDYWNIGIFVSGVSNINFIGTTIIGNNASSPSGTGIEVTGTSSLPPVIFNFIGCTFDNLNTGFQYGNYVQGVTINQSNFNYDTTGIYIAAGQSNLDQLTVSNNQFGPPASGSGTSILANSWVPFTMISNNLFFVNGAETAIYLNTSGLFTIYGNVFHGDAGGNAYGIIDVATSSGNPGVITGNTFNGLYTGIYLQASTTAVNVQSNNYSGNGTNVTNSGSGNTVGGGSK